MLHLLFKLVKTNLYPICCSKKDNDVYVVVVVVVLMIMMTKIKFNFFK